MNLKFLSFTLCLICCGLFSPGIKAEQSTSILAQVDNAENSESLPWQVFSSTSGRFVVDLPGESLEQNSTSILLERELTWHMNAAVSLAVDESDLYEYYLVAYVDLPRGLRYNYSQKELLDAMADQIVNDIEDEEIKRTLVQEEIAFHGLPSRLMTAQGLGQYFAAILSITDNRMYLLLAIDDDEANFEHFYNSFSLVP